MEIEFYATYIELTIDEYDHRRYTESTMIWRKGNCFISTVIVNPEQTHFIESYVKEIVEQFNEYEKENGEITEYIENEEIGKRDRIKNRRFIRR